MKKVILKSLILFSFGIFLTSCGSGKSLHKSKVIYTRDGIDVAVTTPDSRLTFFSKSKKERVCMAPPPDALLTASNDIALAVKTLNSKEKIGDKNSVNTSLLGGRTPKLLIIRELLYRACEMSVNHNLTKTETIDVYKNFLQMAEKITKEMNSNSSNN